MRSYRLLLLDKRVGSRSIDCVEGREAIAAANWELHKCEYVEVSNGVDRFVSVQTRSLITKARNNFTAPHPTHAPLLPLPSIATAPRDGSTIEVRHGPAHLIVRAHWSKRDEFWVQDGDPQRQSLQQVTSWRPSDQGASRST